MKSKTKKILRKMLNNVVSAIDIISRGCVFFVVLLISIAAIDSLNKSFGVYFSIIWLFIIILAGLRIATFGNFFKEK